MFNWLLECLEPLLIAYKGNHIRVEVTARIVHCLKLILYHEITFTMKDTDRCHDASTMSAKRDADVGREHDGIDQEALW